MWVDIKNHQANTIFWKFECDGNFSMQSTYKCQLQSQTPSSFSWCKIWELPCPNMINLFIWRIAQDSLPTATFLHSRKLIPQALRFRCSQEDESILHAIRDCSYADNIWVSLHAHWVVVLSFIWILKSGLCGFAEAHICFMVYPGQLFSFMQHCFYGFGGKISFMINHLSGQEMHHK